MNYQFSKLSSTVIYRPFPELDQWIIECDGNNPRHGTLKELVVYMTQKLGIDLSEIEKAVEDMDIDGLNAAVFGIFGTFMYTFQKDISTRVAS